MYFLCVVSLSLSKCKFLWLWHKFVLNFSFFQHTFFFFIIEHKLSLERTLDLDVWRHVLTGEKVITTATPNWIGLVLYVSVCLKRRLMVVNAKHVKGKSNAINE